MSFDISKAEGDVSPSRFIFVGNDSRITSVKRQSSGQRNRRACGYCQIKRLKCNMTPPYSAEMCERCYLKGQHCPPHVSKVDKRKGSQLCSKSATRREPSPAVPMENTVPVRTSNDDGQAYQGIIQEAGRSYEMTDSMLQNSAASNSALQQPFSLYQTAADVQPFTDLAEGYAPQEPLSADTCWLCFYTLPHEHHP